MIREPGQIIELDGHRVLVAINPTKGCSACSQKTGCGTGLLERWLNPAKQLWINTDSDTLASLKPGDMIELGVEEGAFVRNTLVLYMIPLLIFLLATGIAHWLWGETASVFAGLSGLLAGGFLVRYLVGTLGWYRNGFSPTILHTQSKADPMAFNPDSQQSF